jgi:glycosyltransferase involved in cell wall biosynthesis
MPSKEDSRDRQIILYVVNHAAFFVSHRLPIALEAMKQGYAVHLITGQPGSAIMEGPAEQALRAHGIPHTRVSFTSSGLNPIVESYGLWKLYRAMRDIRPDLVHCVSPKGLLYGGISARLAAVPALVMAVSGMGFLRPPTSTGGAARAAISAAYRLLTRFAYGHRSKRVIVQNHDDLEHIHSSLLAEREEIVLIPGSGVDLGEDRTLNFEDKKPVIVLPARMIYEKGIREFVEAARILKKDFPSWRFLLVGAADYKSLTSVPRAILQGFQSEGIVEWLGHVEDMVPIFRQSSIVCLPSYYGEGLPKALIEAAAYGCAVVTTDSTGCREAILPGISGLLVPPRAVEPLVHELRTLMSDRKRRENLGEAGCRLAAERYDIRVVVRLTLDIYRELLSNACK